MNVSSCLDKLRSPMLGVLFGAAFSLTTQTAKAIDVQGCVKLDGKLTRGVRVEAFDARTCTAIPNGTATTDANGDFVMWGAAGRNEDIYLQYTAPDGCIEIVDNATVRCNIVTNPQDGRYG